MRAWIFAVFSALVPTTFCLAAVTTTIRFPKRVRVSVDRYEDADGNARVGREFAIGYYEKPLDGDHHDYYRAVECGVVGLDVQLVHRHDSRADGSEPPRGTAIDVCYNLFVYVDDADRSATYFSAAVNGDAVARREDGSAASVPGEWFVHRDGGLFGPANGPRRATGAESPPTGSDRRSSSWRTTRGGVDEPAPAAAAETIDAIDERALKAWLRREFAVDREFEKAGGDVVDGTTGAFGRDPPCVEVPQDRDFREFLPTVGCYRVFGDQRCTGVSKMLFWRAESVNELGVFAASAPTDRDSPPFRVQSVTGCCRPRRERPLDGGGGDDELVWSPSFSADGDYEYGRSASTAAEPSPDTTVTAAEPAAPSTEAPTDNLEKLSTEKNNEMSTESSSSRPAVPLAGTDSSLTEPAVADTEVDDSAGRSVSDEIQTFIKKPLSSAVANDPTIVGTPVSLNYIETPMTSTDRLPKPMVDIQRDNFAKHLANEEAKNELVTESLPNAVAKGPTIVDYPTSSSSNDSETAPLASTDRLPEPMVDIPGDNFVEHLANEEAKNEFVSESLPNAVADEPTTAAVSYSSHDSEAPSASADSVTKLVVADARGDNFAGLFVSVETQKVIATDPSSNAVADDPELSTTDATQDSAYDRSPAVAWTEQSEQSDESADGGDGGPNETSVTAPTFVDEAKRAVAVAWDFLTSLAQQILMSTWVAYTTVRRNWSDDQGSE